MKKAKLLFTTFISCITLIIIPVSWVFYNHNIFDLTTTTRNAYAPSPWPPILGKPYPDLELIDQEGKKFKLSYLKGKVIIIEPVGMNCAACQAFSGGHKYGSFKNNTVQQYIESFQEIFPTYAKGLKLPSKDIVFVQLLLYDMNLRTPSALDAKEWAEHFHIYKKENHFVATSPHDLRSRVSYRMIPGFQLIDKNFILRADSTGHNPTHDLYKQLIPMTPKLVRE